LTCHVGSAVVRAERVVSGLAVAAGCRRPPPADAALRQPRRGRRDPVALADPEEHLEHHPQPRPILHVDGDQVLGAEVLLGVLASVSASARPVARLRMAWAPLDQVRKR
jgi:hypothetical protein